MDSNQSLKNKVSLKIANTDYLSRWIVLLADALLSATASILSYYILIYLYNIRLLSTTMLIMIGVSLLSSLIGVYLFKSYRSPIRHSSLNGLWKIIFALLFKVFLMRTIMFFIEIPFSNFQINLTLALDFMLSTFALIGFRICLVTVYHLSIKTLTTAKQKILIYGMEHEYVSLANICNLNFKTDYHIVGFLNFTSGKNQEIEIGNLPAYQINNLNDLKKLILKHHIKGFLFCNKQDIIHEKNRLIAYSLEHQLKLFTVPPIDSWKQKKTMENRLVEISIEDLLERSEIHINQEELEKNLQGKNVLVSGAAGSIGSELCRQIAGFGVKKLILLDNNETGLHNIRLELEANFPHLQFEPIVGDIRSKSRLDYVFKTFSPQFVFHAAAYKHVPLMETNPCEAIYVNAVGSKNMADKAVEYQCEKFIMVSTDKAVNPTNVMGASKRLAEIYVQSLNFAIAKGNVPGKTQFVTTRFGNVLGSQGSVIPLFKKQIEKGGPVTVTHPKITRYFMTIKEACNLVLEASTIGKGGDIMVFDMGKPVKIYDLAKKMITLAGYVPDKDIAIEFTHLRPGEKLYEEVLSNKEQTRATAHEKIRVASVPPYEYGPINQELEKIESLSKEININESVVALKKIIPEYRSNNSEFCKFDTSSPS